MSKDKSRYYLDFNATSPLAKSVVDYLIKGDLPFANPASAHTSGKQSKKIINDTTDFLRNYFKGISKHHVWYHSGATEAINTFLKGLTEDFTVVYALGDHPCICETIKDLAIESLSFSADQDGNFPRENVIKLIKEYQMRNPNKKILLNYTWVHNETGAIWPLEEALMVKKHTGCLVHVDAVQSVGKISDFQNLSGKLDAYTFSGHKFGALKSSGVSFFHRDFKFQPLITGGGQQDGLRAGTENPLAIYCLRLALEDVLKHWKQKNIADLRDEIELMLTQTLGENIVIVAKNAKFGRACNTSCFIYKKQASDLAFIKFDMAGFDISMGSACASQSSKNSPTLLSMGFQELSRHALRISLGPVKDIDQWDFLNSLQNVFNKMS